LILVPVDSTCGIDISIVEGLQKLEDHLSGSHIRKIESALSTGYRQIYPYGQCASTNTRRSEQAYSCKIVSLNRNIGYIYSPISFSSRRPPYRQYAISLSRYNAIGNLIKPPCFKQAPQFCGLYFICPCAVYTSVLAGPAHRLELSSLSLTSLSF
jgi:hypothetical protein